MQRDQKNKLPPYLKNPRSSLPYVIIPPKLPSGASTPINVRPETPSALPPPMQLPPQQTPTIMDSIKQGFGFGIGSSIARSVFGNSSHEKVQLPQETATAPYIDEFIKCMERTVNNMDDCKYLLTNDNNV
jgi:hypothetical protein